MAKKTTRFLLRETSTGQLVPRKDDATEAGAIEAATKIVTSSDNRISSITVAKITEAEVALVGVPVTVTKL